MKTSGITTIILCLFIFSLQSFSQNDPKEKGLSAITREAVRGQLEFLSSDWTEGRNTGDRGEYMAADYIVSLFKIYGLQPGGDVGYTTLSRQDRMQGKQPEKFQTYYQSFNLIEYSDGENNELDVLSKSTTGNRIIHFKPGTDFRTSTAEPAIEITAPIVFVGYGYVNKEAGYDDFKGVDVKDKIILRLAGYPGSSDTLSKAYKTFNKEREISLYRLRNDKNEAAKERGALAILETDPDNPDAFGQPANIPFRYNERMYEGDVPPPNSYRVRMKIPEDTLSADPVGIYIGQRVLNEILTGSGINIGKFAETVKQTLKPAPLALPGKTVRIKTDVNSRLIRVRNVVGVIPGKDTNNVVVLGGHYDHLGKQGGYIWNGADDNASGTVGVMTIAKAFMASGVKPEKTIVFCAWTGEEKGLLGSRYFVDHSSFKNILFYLNYDMISRDSPDDSLGINCGLTYTTGYPSIEENTKKFNEEMGYGLEISYRHRPQPGGGSDHSSFARKGIPIMYFMAGFPKEYHQPDDHVELVNFDKMVKIIKLGYLNIWEIANGELKKTDQAPPKPDRFDRYY